MKIPLIIFRLSLFVVPTFSNGAMCGGWEPRIQWKKKCSAAPYANYPFPKNPIRLTLKSFISSTAICSGFLWACLLLPMLLLLFSSKAQTHYISFHFFLYIFISPLLLFSKRAIEQWNKLYIVTRGSNVQHHQSSSLEFFFLDHSKFFLISFLLDSFLWRINFFHFKNHFELFKWP